MRYNITFTPLAGKIISKWKKSNRSSYNKLLRVIEDIALHPRTGIGHPEPLVGGSNMTYSRHITAHDRIIYDVYDDTVTVLVIQVSGHYNDK